MTLPTVNVGPPFSQRSDQPAWTRPDQPSLCRPPGWPPPRPGPPPRRDPLGRGAGHNGARNRVRPSSLLNCPGARCGMGVVVSVAGTGSRDLKQGTINLPHRPMSSSRGRPARAGDQSRRKPALATCGLRSSRLPARPFPRPRSRRDHRHPGRRRPGHVPAPESAHLDTRRHRDLGCGRYEV
jgi:hypothetical protein